MPCRPSHLLPILQRSAPLLLCGLLGCTTSPQTQPQPTDEALIREEILGLHLRWFDDGLPSAELQADRMQRLEDGTSVRQHFDSPAGNPIEIVLYAGEDTLGRLVATRMIRQESTEIYQFEDHVQLRFADRRHLEADTLIWFRDQRRIEVPGRVRLTTDQEVLTGSGLRADQDFTTYTLADVSGTITLDEVEEP
jgi:hypothetical protein